MKAARSMPDGNDAYCEAVEALEAASGPDRVVDLMLAYATDQGSQELRRTLPMLIEEGFSWAAIGEVLASEAAGYTGSLDAALPWERVVFTMYSRKRRQWSAIHRAADGRETAAWAATEPLARRLAAMKAATGEAAVSEQTYDKVVEPVSEEQPRANDGEDEWRIMF